jgi:asparagine synthase (glutamine-hydrolysing)
MCGIAGFVDPGGAGLAELRGMCDALAHRGPDDADARAWPDHGVALGHRRLAIIDLSPAGRNPLPNEDETVWIVHNGEIYNHRELRRELERAGHRFRSHSDTEVIVHAYEEWGSGHVDRLRGMFAYAIYDRREVTPRVLLVRDRLGIKPLHYAWDGRRLAFASELKAFRGLAWVDRAPDLDALADYLTLQYVPAPKTAFAGIRKLAPGQLLAWEGDRPAVRTYWDVEPSTTTTVGCEEAVAMLRASLPDAVAAHMVADVPVGLFLSGGLDSGAVASFMGARADRPVHAYSIGFDVAEHSETAYATLIADRLGLEHTVRTVGVGAVREALDRVGGVHDEPFADGSAVPTLRLSELASEDVKVVLSGDGGDEVFAGYRWYDRWMQGTRAEVVPRPLRRAVFGALGALPGEGRVRRVADLAGGGLERYAGLIELFSPAAKRRVLAPTLAADLHGADDHWHLRAHWREDLDPMTRVQYLDLKTYLPGDILTKVDRASMSVSLEVRPPLLDHRLVEAVFALPASVRVPDGRAKGLLKDAMADRLPPEILDRPKKGFSAPWETWLPELRSWAAAEVRDGAAVQAGVLAPDPMSRIGRRQPGARAWGLLVLERWCRDNL